MVQRGMINKYGILVREDLFEVSPGADAVDNILKHLPIKYQREFFFDIVGLRRKKFDFAVFSKEEPEKVAFLIEFDGSAHYDENFHNTTGLRPCRWKVHLTRTHISDAIGTQIALKMQVPLLRLTTVHMGCLRNLILSYIWIFVDKNTDKCKEISLVKMLDKYGWDFDYVEPSEFSNNEREFLEERRKRLGRTSENNSDTGNQSIA